MENVETPSRPETKEKLFEAKELYKLGLHLNSLATLAEEYGEQRLADKTRARAAMVAATLASGSFI